MDKTEAEAANQHLARTWYDGLELTFAGVDLGDCLQYSLLSVVGRIWLAPVAQPAVDPQAAANV